MPEVEITLPKWHPQQLEWWQSPASELLIGGDTRAGKSFYVRKALILWCSQIPGLQCDIFRLHQDDVIKENMVGETSFPVLLTNWERAGLVKINQLDITFWNDSKIFLEHCNDDTVMSKHRGIAKHVRVFGESSQILEHRIRALTGWVTMSEEMKARVPEKWKGQFPKVIHVTNTVGISSNYFRRNFVDARPPRSIEKVGAFNRQYIPAFLDGNPSENADDVRARIKEAFTDEAIQKALISEDKNGISAWHTATGSFFPEWNESRHVVADCRPPYHWFRFRAFDWGTSEPFCVLWAAVSDGEPFKDHNGRDRWFPRGALLVYNEWYGCNQHDNAKGLGMRNEDIAEGILNRSEYEHRNVITLADSKPFQSLGGYSIADVFANCGVLLERADTSRVTGWSQFRSRLIGKQIDTFSPKIPMIFFCECCLYSRSYIPAIERHKSEGKREDAAEHGEATHAPDTARYLCTAYSHNVIKDRLEPMESRIMKQLLAPNTMRELSGGRV